MLHHLAMIFLTVCFTCSGKVTVRFTIARCSKLPSSSDESAGRDVDENSPMPDKHNLPILKHDFALAGPSHPTCMSLSLVVHSVAMLIYFFSCSHLGSQCSSNSFICLRLNGGLSNSLKCVHADASPALQCSRASGPSLMMLGKLGIMQATQLT